jgi:hypothetical protein
MTSRFILYTSPSTFCTYKKERLPSTARTRYSITSTIVLLLSCSRVSPCQFSACTECWESMPPEPPSAWRHLLECADDQVFGERLRDCLLLPSDCRRRLLLLPWIVYFPVDVRGTALQTSSCIDCDPRHQATHYVD